MARSLTRALSIAAASATLLLCAGVHARPLLVDRTFGSFDGALLANDGYVVTPIRGAEETPTDTRSPVPFSIDFFGTVYDSLYISENGVISFGAPFPGTPGTLTDLANSGIPFIAPFFADADMGATLFTHDDGSGNQVPSHGGVGLAFTFGVNMFINVTSTYQGSTDVPALTNSLQVALFGSTTSTDFRLDFNYGDVQWESGNSDGGINGLGGGALLIEGASADCPPGSPSVGCYYFSFLFRDGVPYYRADGAPVFPVPEPAIWALVALGIVLLWLGRPRPKS